MHWLAWKEALVCPLAKASRLEFKRRSTSHIHVVVSRPLIIAEWYNTDHRKREDKWCEPPLFRRVESDPSIYRSFAKPTN